MTDKTTITITKENRDWLEGLKRKWAKKNLNAVVDHFKYYYDGDDYDYYAENEKQNV